MLLGFLLAVGILQFYYCGYLFNIRTLGKSDPFVPVPGGQLHYLSVTLTRQTVSPQYRISVRETHTHFEALLQMF